MCPSPARRVVYRVRPSVGAVAGTDFEVGGVRVGERGWIWVGESSAHHWKRSCSHGAVPDAGGAALQLGARLDCLGVPIPQHRSIQQQ